MIKNWTYKFYKNVLGSFVKNHTGNIFLREFCPWEAGFHIFIIHMFLKVFYWLFIIIYYDITFYYRLWIIINIILLVLL